jgi:hypothetical protein
MALDHCERIGLFSRDTSDDPWRFTPHPENFAKAPLKAPVREGRGRKKKSQNAPMPALHAEEIPFPDSCKETSVAPPPGLFAEAGNGHGRRANPTFLPSSELPDEPSNEEMHFHDEVVVTTGRVLRFKEMHFSEREMHFPRENEQFSARETYCPWNWPCPFLSNELARPKNLREPEESCSTSSNVVGPTVPSAGDQTHRSAEGTFADNLTKVFGDHPGKGIPTPKQCAEVLLTLPGDPDAIAAFPQWVDTKIQRIRHPGVLPSLAVEFKVEWQHAQERRAATIVAEQRSATEADQRATQVAAEEQLDGRVEESWKRLTAENQLQRLQIARDKLRAEERWSRLSAEMRDKEIHRLAILDLRREMAGTQFR